MSDNKNTNPEVVRGETPCGDVPPEELKRIENQAKGKISALCTKCKERKSVIYFRRDSTCWNCFEDLFVRKFKQQLNLGRKTKTKSEKVLIAFSGGPSSRTLLHLISECISSRNANSAFFEIQSVIHIDESSVIGISAEEQSEKNRKIEEIVSSYGFKTRIVPIESVFSYPSLLSTVDKIPNDIIGDNNIEKVKTLFQNCTSNTSKEDLLEILRSSLLAHITKEEGLDKILLGTTSTRMSIQLIALTCKGRGFTIPEELSPHNESKFHFNDNSQVNFVYPMRDTLGKEIAIYNRTKKLEVLIIPTFDTMTPNLKFSINHLAENFIEELQRDFPHTVHTLLRSGGKLTMQSSSSDTHLRCALCSCTLNSNEIASVMSSSNKGKTTTEEKKSDDCCNNNKSDGCCSNNNNGKEEEGSCCSSNNNNNNHTTATVELTKYVCYGCKKLVHESDQKTLPPFIENRARSTMVSSSLREQIKDFLIDEEEDS